jgi:hypothetical protein
MHIWKVASFVTLAATVLVFGYGVARAQGAAACNNQPNMAGAIGALRKARGYLERAEHDKGGWRARAIQSTDVAIRETERGCAFADTH